MFRHQRLSKKQIVDAPPRGQQRRRNSSPNGGLVLL